MNSVCACLVYSELHKNNQKQRLPLTLKAAQAGLKRRYNCWHWSYPLVL